jgi:hypothetical protein
LNNLSIFGEKATAWGEAQEEWGRESGPIHIPTLAHWQAMFVQSSGEMWIEVVRNARNGRKKPDKPLSTRRNSTASDQWE